LLEDQQRLPPPPGILVLQQIDEVCGSAFREVIRGLTPPARLVRDFVYTTSLAVPDIRIGVVANLWVVPVGHVDRAVRPGAELDGAEVRVVGDEKALAVAAGVGRAVALQDVSINPRTVQVHHEDAAVPLVGIGSALVDKAAGMGVPAADLEAA